MRATGKDIQGATIKMENKTVITAYAGTELSVEYGTLPRTACRLKTKGYGSLNIELFPDEARLLINELEKFLVRAAQRDPAEFKKYVRRE